ncbi:MAG: ATP synthase subunit C [Lachnospiraceae bacterium]|jgi:V/A-type H+-transporting ATPase subunit K
MTTLIQFTTAAALILSIIVPMGYFFLGEKTKARYKKSLVANCCLFFGALLVGTIVMFSGAVSVEAAETAASSAGLATGLGYLSAALVTGISGIGSGIAVASAASAALGAISEDGSLFGKSMIFVAMAEGIALYGLIISFMILGRL